MYKRILFGALLSCLLSLPTHAFDGGVHISWGFTGSFGYVPQFILSPSVGDSINPEPSVIEAYYQNLMLTRINNILGANDVEFETTWVPPINMIIRSSGTAVVEPMNGASDCAAWDAAWHFGNNNIDAPTITVSGGGDILCLLGAQETRDMNDIVDLWVLTGEGDFVIHPMPSSGFNTAQSFGPGVMTDAEEVFCVQNTWTCSRVYSEAPVASLIGGLCETGGDDGHIGNAVQHALWAALSARTLKRQYPQYTIEQAIAQSAHVLDRHEEIGGVQCGGQQSSTDCANNDVGWDVLRQNPGLVNQASPFLVKKVIEQMETRATVLGGNKLCSVVDLFDF